MKLHAFSPSAGYHSGSMPITNPDPDPDPEQGNTSHEATYNPPECCIILDHIVRHPMWPMDLSKRRLLTEESFFAESLLKTASQSTFSVTAQLPSGSSDVQSTSCSTFAQLQHPAQPLSNAVSLCNTPALFSIPTSPLEQPISEQSPESFLQVSHSVEPGDVLAESRLVKQESSCGGIEKYHGVLITTSFHQLVPQHFTRAVWPQKDPVLWAGNSPKSVNEAYFSHGNSPEIASDLMLSWGFAWFELSFKEF